MGAECYLLEALLCAVPKPSDDQVSFPVLLGHLSVLEERLFIPEPILRVCALSRVRLCNPVDCSPPGSSAHGISKARILEWAAIFSSRGSSRPRDRTRVSWFPACAFGYFCFWCFKYAKHLLDCKVKKICSKQPRVHSARA